MAGEYPAALDVDPPAQQDRLSVLLRLLFVIPHIVLLAFVGIASAVVTLLAWFAIVITGRYPEGMLRFSVGALRWSTRVQAYIALLTDRYPPFSLDDDRSYPVRLHVASEVEERNRLTAAFRLLLAIPHWIVLGVLNLVVRVLLVIAWVIALLTGSVPGGLHEFLAGWLRWSTRVSSYVLLQVDPYPPFSMS
jgi:hypothetical protein